MQLYKHKFKQISGSNKFLIEGDGKMKRMQEPWDRAHWRDASNGWGHVQKSARGSIKAAEVHKDNEMKGWKGNKRTRTNILGWKGRPKIENLQSAQDL